MLSLKNVGYHPAATPSPIIENINFNLEPQKLGLIVGKSGSGKTTLLEILAGLAENTSGKIFWKRRNHLRRTTTTKRISISIPRKTFLWL